MATAAVISTIPSSFAYKDLISQVQTIQNQMEIYSNMLDSQVNDKNKSKVKSRSLCFIDPYGNPMIDQYMDHESINKVIKNCKKNYVPKYLQEWIKIGTVNQGVFSLLSDRELSSIVANYVDGYQFFTYGEVTVWLGRYENPSFEPLVLDVQVMDNMEKVKMQINKRTHSTNMELKLCTKNQNANLNNNDWNEGTTLNTEDTIMSCQLYRNDRTIMVKLGREKVNNYLFFSDLL
jgi:hypothetical protein